MSSSPVLAELNFHSCAYTQSSSDGGMSSSVLAGAKHLWQENSSGK